MSGKSGDEFSAYFCYFYCVKYKKNMRRKRDCVRLGKWYTGWHDWKFMMRYDVCGYEDGNGRLHLSLLGWHSVFKMPWKSRRFPDGDCDAPSWGTAIHSSTFWIYKGGDGNGYGGNRWWTWDIPFFTKKHIRHDVVCNLGDYDGNPDLRLVPYETLVKADKDYCPLEKNDLVYKYRYDYTDKYDGEVIPCTFWVEEREWRPKWLTWTGRWKKVERYIEIVFSEEVGRGKGGWKGGCLGCGYVLKEGETPMECIRRMERQRRF